MRIVSAKRIWVMTLLVAAWQGAFAEEVLKTASATQSQGPPFVTMIRSVELPAMAGNGQLRMAKVPKGAIVQLVKVDGDRVEVIHQGLTVRMPAIMTDLPIRAQVPKPSAESAAPPVRPVAASAGQATPPSQPAPDAQTFIKSSMNEETFKAAGLDKLSPAELEALDNWLLSIVLTSRRANTSLQHSDPLLAMPGRRIGSFERALLIKNFNGERVLVQRANGEKWMLRAKTWCRWSWRYEGRHVCLVFGPTTSQLINDYGETYDFWTDKQVE